MTRVGVISDEFWAVVEAHGCGRDADGAAGRDGRPGRKGAAKEKPVEKRVTAPAVPNGQPVKGRLTVPPSAPTTKPTDGKPVVRRRILLPEHKDFGRIAPDEKTDAGE